MENEAITFAGLLCSRLCHDVLSPMGALGNGLDLLAQETDPAMQAECLALLTQSNQAALNKLRFFRLAFGASSGRGDGIEVAELCSALEGVFPASRPIDFRWHLGNGPLPRTAAKILLNLGLIAGDALVRGGQLDLAVETRGPRTELVVRAEAERIALDPEIRRTLLNALPATELTPRLAPAWMAAQLAQSGGEGLQISPADARFLLFGAVLIS